MRLILAENIEAENNLKKPSNCKIVYINTRNTTINV